MSALNFKAYLAPAILDGSKILTLRAPRKDGRDPAPVGRPLSLFTGMRTASCRRIFDTECVYRCGVQLSPGGLVSAFDEVGDLCGKAGRLVNGGVLAQGSLRASFLAAFAKADGFASWTELWAFHEAQGLDAIGGAVRELVAWRPPAARGEFP